MPFTPPGIPQESGDTFYDSLNGVTYAKTAANQWRVVKNTQGRFSAVGDYASIFLGAKPIRPEIGHIWYPLSGSRIGESHIWNGTAWVQMTSGESHWPADFGIY